MRDPSSPQVYRERYIDKDQLEPVAMQRWDATDTLVATRYFVYGLVPHVLARRVAGALGPSRGVPEAGERRPGAAGDAQASSRTTERTIRGLQGRLRRRESTAAARQMLDESGNRFAFVTDQVGSVRQVVEVSTGALVQSMRYTAFGEVLEDEDFSADFPPQPFGYAGGLYDRETGFVRFGARDYDATTRRWTAKDPIRFGGGDTNLFAYVGNDPVEAVDPTGLWPYNDVSAGDFSRFLHYYHETRRTNTVSNDRYGRTLDTSSGALWQTSHAMRTAYADSFTGGSLSSDSDYRALVANEHYWTARWLRDKLGEKGALALSVLYDEMKLRGPIPRAGDLEVSPSSDFSSFCKILGATGWVPK